MKSVGSCVEEFDRPARHQQTALVFEVRTARGCACNDLLCKRLILRMYALEHHVDVWFLGAVVFENAIALVGPHDLSGIRFPPEAACLTQLWGVGKIGFAAPDSFFHHFTFGDIRYRADDLVVAGLVPKAMCQMMKMLYRTVRHQQAMLQVKASSALRTFEELFEPAHILGMRS